MYVPRRYGGLEVDVPTFMRVGVEMARGDMGAAWGACLSANHALQIASWFPEQTQDDVFGNGDFRAASVAAPTVQATRTADGFRLEGVVAYCSGIPYSTWYLGQAMLDEKDEAGAPRLIMFVAPRKAFTQLNDWGDTLGLKSTGSHAIRFDGAELPAHYVLEDANMVDMAVENGTPGLALHGNPMYGGRALVIFTLSLACTMVGGGYNALDEYAQLGAREADAAAAVRAAVPERGLPALVRRRDDQAPDRRGGDDAVRRDAHGRVPAQRGWLASRTCGPRTRAWPRSRAR